jgi:hypothetical protein
MEMETQNREIDMQTRRCLHLLASVMLQCITDHQENIKKNGIVVAMGQEAARWIMSDDNRPFGFVWCCKYLDLVPERLRATMNATNLVSGARNHLRKQAEQRQRMLYGRNIGKSIYSTCAVD